MAKIPAQKSWIRPPGFESFSKKEEVISAVIIWTDFGGTYSITTQDLNPVASQNPSGTYSITTQDRNPVASFSVGQITWADTVVPHALCQPPYNSQKLSGWNNPTSETSILIEGAYLKLLQHSRCRFLFP
ncbi:1451_t:CDS:2 [Paraglomus brasilianum]|uniref:1451_t:CDS:1 n=1 Tax=Paraglomus brasilianum TaxID=144538 RepID=A0A9N9BNM6_9GLOM|nr:1451_t:CDS:2 [Paraglomus brasilianum]